ncbi:hypothetical protein EMIHUDRAFT_229721 [Emiliania huxleyi CCMP1516]|uniref:Uncharacterized protein n=2 Tax=Emiliania huxleyi TaxID=2903 RepID=A0A0D3KCA9_EMIH1|nr:hypothetical protein EMIHUDRAFT_229721 [Emiliania huxleyi CCMP1516]EOD33394.1 hypothetical protein EMIHUDRAFT_229721 [Emiliania huxleyi CCMP1516]|eukprot:XP_005785823.1 hypothetical protein EMIHUDRAFT_229721 [Emiliania huxleyi CCMP1516]
MSFAVNNTYRQAKAPARDKLRPSARRSRPQDSFDPNGTLGSLWCEPDPGAVAAARLPSPAVDELAAHPAPEAEALDASAPPPAEAEAEAPKAVAAEPAQEAQEGDLGGGREEEAEAERALEDVPEPGEASCECGLESECLPTAAEAQEAPAELPANLFSWEGAAPGEAAGKPPAAGRRSLPSVAKVASVASVARAYQKAALANGTRSSTPSKSPLTAAYERAVQQSSAPSPSGGRTPQLARAYERAVERAAKPAGATAVATAKAAYEQAVRAAGVPKAAPVATTAELFSWASPPQPDERRRGSGAAAGERRETGAGAPRKTPGPGQSKPHGSEPSQPPAPADRAPPQAALSAAAAAPPPVTVPPADGDALSEAARSLLSLFLAPLHRALAPRGAPVSAASAAASLRGFGASAGSVELLLPAPVRKSVMWVVGEELPEEEEEEDARAPAAEPPASKSPAAAPRRKGVAWIAGEDPPEGAAGEEENSMCLRNSCGKDGAPPVSTRPTSAMWVI